MIPKIVFVLVAMDSLTRLKLCGERVDTYKRYFHIQVNKYSTKVIICNKCQPHTMMLVILIRVYRLDSFIWGKASKAQDSPILV